MKKIIIVITFILLTISSYSQLMLVKPNIFAIKDSTTQYWMPVPKNTTIINYLDGKIWQIMTNEISTKTLATSTKRLLGGSGGGGASDTGKISTWQIDTAYSHIQFNDSIKILGNLILPNITTTTGQTKGLVIDSITNEIKWQTLTSGDTSFWSRNVSKVYPTNIGDSIGIGTSTPTARLHIKGSVANSTAYSQKVDNSSNEKLLHIRNDGQVEFKNYTFPIADGSANYILKTNGSGVLSWTLTPQDSILVDTRGNIMFDAYTDSIFRAGYQSGFSITSSNTKSMYIGTRSGKQFTSGDANITIGYEAGMLQQGGDENVFIGNRSGRGTSLHSKTRNVFVGAYTGEITQSGGNVFLGFAAGYSNISGVDNVYTGFTAGLYSTGSNNVFNGSYAGYNNTSGYSNVYVGKDAGKAQITGYESLIAGYLAGGQVNGLYRSVILGNQAGASATGRLIAIGYNAGYNSTGDANTFIGVSSGVGNTTGYNNTCTGYETGKTLGAANDCTLYGTSAGAVTTGDNNTAIGSVALNLNTTGSYNVAIGGGASNKNVAGINNCVIGAGSFYMATSGSGNVSLGIRSGENKVSGDSNTFLGSYTGRNGTGSRNLFIGYEAGMTNLGNDSMIIDNHDNRQFPFIAANFATHKLTINGDLYISRTFVTDTIILNGDTITDIVPLTNATGNIGNYIAPLDTIFSFNFINKAKNTGEIVAGTGITASMLAGSMRFTGTSPIDISANPQIVAVPYNGYRIRITGMSDTNTLTLDDGNGLDLPSTRVLGLHDTIELEYDLTNAEYFETNFTNN